MRKGKSNKTLLAAVIVGLIFGAGVGFFCYRVGVESGKKVVRDEIKEELEELGETIVEKNELAEKLKNELGAIGTTMTIDNVNEIIEKLENVSRGVKNEKVKSKLGELSEKVREVATAYENGSDEEIQEKFNVAKEAAERIGAEITEIFNTEIEAGAEKVLEN